MQSKIDSVGVDNLSPRFGGVKSHKNLLFGKGVLYWDEGNRQWIYKGETF